MSATSEPHDLRVHVKGVGREGNPIVYLGTRTRVLPIWIAQAEANAIALAVRGERFIRPLTAELLADTIQATGHQVEKLVVTKIEDRTFYGELHLRRGGKRGPVIDCRPSDGIGLALRAKAPIYVNSAVMQTSALPADKVGALADLPELQAGTQAPADLLLQLLTGIHVSEFVLTFTTQGQRSARSREGVAHYQLPLPPNSFREMTDYLSKQAGLKRKGKDTPVSGAFELEHKRTFRLAVSTALPKRGLPRAIQVSARSVYLPLRKGGGSAGGELPALRQTKRRRGDG